jgi:GntR family transcriptional regulator
MYQFGAKHMAAESAALPKYAQTAEMLIREIASGRLADGTRLPPEREMAKDLGLAVGTLRKALGDLETRGLLERRQGSGNYIRHRPEAAGIYAFFRLERLEGGGLPTAVVLDVGRHRFLRDGGGEYWTAYASDADFIRIRRLRRLDGLPAAIEEIWLDHPAELAAADLSEALYRFYRRKLGLWIVSAEDRIGLAPAPDWAPKEFGQTSGEATGFVERLGRVADGRALEYSRTWFDASVCRYMSRMR